MKETKALKMAAVFALQGHAKPMLRPNIPDIYRCKSALRHERKNDGDLDYECETTAGQRHRLSFTMQPLLTQLVMRWNIGDEYRLPTIIAVSPVTKYLSPCQSHVRETYNDHSHGYRTQKDTSHAVWLLIVPQQYTERREISKFVKNLQSNSYPFIQTFIHCLKAVT